MLGLGKPKEAPKVKATDNKENKSASTSASDEAKAILAKMEAKKDAGDCPFC